MDHYVNYLELYVCVFSLFMSIKVFLFCSLGTAHKPCRDCFYIVPRWQNQTMTSWKSNIKKLVVLYKGGSEYNPYSFIQRLSLTFANEYFQLHVRIIRNLSSFSLKRVKKEGSEERGNLNVVVCAVLLYTQHEWNSRTRKDIM